jgi:proteic killer suppression protein
MIRSFRHKGLKRLHEDDDARGSNTGHVEKLRRILGRLDIARVPQDLDLPGYRLHPLKGDLEGFGCDGSGELARRLSAGRGPGV